MRFLPRAAEWAALFFVIDDGDSSPHWVKVKNPKAPAVKREAEEDWGSPYWIKNHKAAGRRAAEDWDTERRTPKNSPSGPPLPATVFSRQKKSPVTRGGGAGKVGQETPTPYQRIPGGGKRCGIIHCSQKEFAERQRLATDAKHVAGRLHWHQDVLVAVDFYDSQLHVLSRRRRV